MLNFITTKVAEIFFSAFTFSFVSNPVILMYIISFLTEIYSHFKNNSKTKNVKIDLKLNKPAAQAEGADSC